MTVKEVRDEVKRIAALGDPEAQHLDEDALHQQVLGEIAEGALNAKGLAAAALRTTKLQFARWYA